jgi:hypothetical protein
MSRIDSLADLIGREKRADRAHVNWMIGLVLVEEAKQQITIPWPQVLQIVDETIRLEALIEAVTAMVLADNATTAAFAGERLLSLKCRMYAERSHDPCSGTTDDGTERACQCWCHS